MDFTTMLLKVCESGVNESAAAASSHSIASAIATPARNQRSKANGNSAALNRSASPLYDNIDELLESLRITEQNLARRRQPRLYKRTVSDTGLHPLQNIDLILRDCRRPAPISTRIPVAISNSPCGSTRRSGVGGTNVKPKMRISGGVNGLPPISPPSSTADVRLRHAAANSHRHDGAADSAYHSSGHSSYCEDADQESSISSTSTRPLSTASGNSSGESGVSDGSETTLRVHTAYQCEVGTSSCASPPVGSANAAPSPNSMESAATAPQPAAGDYMQKVVAEMLDTERSYVSDLRDVVEGYMKPLQNYLQNVNLPPCCLFGNLEEILLFNKTFLQKLTDCCYHCVRIAQCFIDHSDGFMIYTAYCTNYPGMISQLNDLLVDQNFKMTITVLQTNLKHSLPLGAYLLKPVQRLLKYHLFLQNMLKVSRECAKIQSALECMTKLARNINVEKRKQEQLERQKLISNRIFSGDSLKPWNVFEFGNLLLEDRFRLFAAKSIRTLFLFDKALLITKQRSDFAYETKMKIDASDIALQENVSDALPLVFRIWPFSEPALTFSLMARSLEQKREWIRQIKSIMLNNAKISVPQAARDLIMQAECNWDEDILACSMWQKNGTGSGSGNQSTPVAQRRRKSVEIAEKFRISKKYFRSKSSSDLGPASREKEKRDSVELSTSKRRNREQKVAEFFQQRKSSNEHRVSLDMAIRFFRKPIATATASRMKRMSKSLDADDMNRLKLVPTSQIPPIARKTGNRIQLQPAASSSNLAPNRPNGCVPNASQNGPPEILAAVSIPPEIHMAVANPLYATPVKKSDHVEREVIEQAYQSLMEELGDFEAARPRPVKPQPQKFSSNAWEVFQCTCEHKIEPEPEAGKRNLGTAVDKAVERLTELLRRTYASSSAKENSGAAKQIQPAIELYSNLTPKRPARPLAGAKITTQEESEEKLKQAEHIYEELFEYQLDRHRDLYEPVDLHRDPSESAGRHRDPSESDSLSFSEFTAKKPAAPAKSFPLLLNPVADRLDIMTMSDTAVAVGSSDINGIVPLAKRLKQLEQCCTYGKYRSMANGSHGPNESCGRPNASNGLCSRPNGTCGRPNGSYGQFAVDDKNGNFEMKENSAVCVSENGQQMISGFVKSMIGKFERH